MINKHFFKTLLLFTLMIGMGLVFIFVISYFDDSVDAEILNTMQIAK